MGILKESKQPKSSLTAVRPSKERIMSYGNRRDGTPKGAGYFGEIQNPYEKGSYSTELSMTVNVGGRDMDVPLIVPTLNEKELHALLKAKSGQEVPESVVMKATDFAKARLSAGKSPYADPDENYLLPKKEKERGVLDSLAEAAVTALYPIEKAADFGVKGLDRAADALRQLDPEASDAARARREEKIRQRGPMGAPRKSGPY